MSQFHKAERKKGKLRLAIAGPAGAGTRLLNFSLPWENYQLYCHKRYSVASLAELTDDQIKEQTKLLDSLKRPDRLEAFREVLGGLNGAAQGQRAAAVQ
jgi:hypothetical protein